MLSIEKKDRSRSKLYSRRAKYYKILHHLSTRFRDIVWRQEAAWLANLKEDFKVLDVCTGIGLSAIEYLKVWEYQGVTNAHITGLDLNQEMLAVGRKEIAKRGLKDKIDMVLGDVTNLREEEKEKDMAYFAAETFDAVLCVCGIGGITEYKKAFQEMLRVVKDKGRVVIIDLYKPLPGVHRFHAIQKLIWDKLVAPFLLYKFWGWTNPAGKMDEIKHTSFIDDNGKQWKFKIIENMVRQESFFNFFPLTTKVVVGEKIKDEGFNEDR